MTMDTTTDTVTGTLTTAPSMEVVRIRDVLTKPVPLTAVLLEFPKLVINTVVEIQERPLDQLDPNRLLQLGRIPVTHPLEVIAAATPRAPKIMTTVTLILDMLTLRPPPRPCPPSTRKQRSTPPN